jgi:uncharacterized coiled-coil protein SlyX
VECGRETIRELQSVIAENRSEYELLQKNLKETKISLREWTKKCERFSELNTTLQKVL